MKILPNILTLEIELDQLLNQFKTLVNQKKHISEEHIYSSKYRWSIWCHKYLAHNNQYFLHFHVPGDGMKARIFYISDLLMIKDINSEKIAKEYIKSYEWNKTKR